MSDSFIPILIHLTDAIRVNDVALVDENVTSFEEFAATLYQSLRPAIPEFYLENGERTITRAYVTWCAADNFPMETEILESNMRAVLRLLAARRGVDSVRVWLNEIDDDE